MDILSPNRAAHKPLDDIDRHPNLAFWGGVLIISVDYQTPTPQESAVSMSALTRILPDYSFWAQLVKIDIHTPRVLPHLISDAEYKDQIETMKCIVTQLNTFPDLVEVRMRILMDKWHILRLELGAGLFGLENVPWILYYEVRGRDLVEIHPNCSGMLRLRMIWEREFQRPNVKAQENVEPSEEVLQSEATESSETQPSEEVQPTADSDEELRLREAMQLLELIQPRSDDKYRSQWSRWRPKCRLPRFRRRHG